MRKWLRRVTRPAVLGTLRRTTPLSDDWGFDRGNAVDRYYIERFLTEYRRDITGRISEVQSSWYANPYGTGVTGCDVLERSTRRTRVLRWLSTFRPPMIFPLICLTVSFLPRR